MLRAGMGWEDLRLSKAILLQSSWTSLYQWNRRPQEDTRPIQGRTASSWPTARNPALFYPSFNSAIAATAASTSELFSSLHHHPPCWVPLLPEWEAGSSLHCFCFCLWCPNSPPFRVIFSDNGQPLTIFSFCPQEESPNSLATQSSWLKV